MPEFWSFRTGNYGSSYTQSVVTYTVDQIALYRGHTFKVHQRTRITQLQSMCMHLGFLGWVALYECTEAGVPTELLAYHRVNDVHPSHGYNLDATKGTWVCCGGSTDPQYDSETGEPAEIICNISSFSPTVVPGKWYLIAHGSRGRKGAFYQRFSAMTCLSNLNVANLKAANPNFEEFETGPTHGFFCYRNMVIHPDAYNQGLGCPSNLIGMAPTTNETGILAYYPNVGFSGYILGPGEDAHLYPSPVSLNGNGYLPEVLPEEMGVIYAKVNGIWKSSNGYAKIAGEWKRISKGYIYENEWRSIR